MEPQRLNPDEEPVIRPKFGVIQGGGEGDGQSQGQLSVVEGGGEEDGAPENVGPALSALEGGGETTPRSRGHLQAVGSDAESGKELGQKEDNAAKEEYGPSAADRLNKHLNSGYKGDDRKKTPISNMWNGSSKLKKRMALAGVLAGGSAAAGVIGFMALLPFKIETIVNNLETHFSAEADGAVSDEVDNIFMGYVKMSIMPALGAGKCHSTVSPKCVVVAHGTGPLGQLYAAWSKVRLENTLANKFGLIITKEGNSFYMYYDSRATAATDYIPGPDAHANRIDISDLRTKGLADTDFYKNVHTKQVTRSELRRAVKDALKQGTMWDRTYRRFVVNRYLARQFGIKHCIIACDTRDAIAGTIADKKLAAQAFLLQRLVPEKYGVVMQCALLGGCDTKLAPAVAGDEDKMSPAQKKIRDSLISAAAKFGTEDLEALSKASKDLADKGFMQMVTKQLVGKVVGYFADDAATAAAAGDAAADSIPVVGWAMLASQILDAAAHIGPTIRFMAYTAGTASAIEMFESYNTVASECKSGNCDETKLGSFTQALSTNLTGSKDDQSDATSTPLYASLSDGTSQPTKAYLCADGTPLLNMGGTVCPEEVLDVGNGFANALSGFINRIPVLPQVAHVINLVSQKLFEPIGMIAGPVIKVTFEAVCHGTMDLNPFMNCNQAQAEVKQAFGSLFSWLQTKMIPTPFTKNMSGGRNYDLLAAGADAAHNDACHSQLGCAVVTPAQHAQVIQQMLADQKADFDQKSMFARMFDTESQNSLISQLAVSMPSNLVTAGNAGVASLIANPFSKIGSAFSSLLTKNHAFADTMSDQDVFGIVQFGYPSDQIPTDPQAYWDAHCTDPNEYTNWLNSNTQDPNTGIAVSSTPDPCQLIKQSVASAGGMFDASLLPARDLVTTDSSSGTTTTASSASPADCQNGTATGNAKIVCSAYKFDGLTYSQSGPRGDWNFLACVNSNFAGTCGSQYPAGSVKRTVDCSSMATYAIKDGIGFDMKVYNTSALGSSPYLQKVPWDQAQPGDLVLNPGDHVEVVVSNDTAHKKLNTFGAHTHYATHPADDVSPGSFTYNTSGFSVYRVTPK